MPLAVPTPADALPAAPTRGSAPAVFSPAVAAFLAAMVTYRGQANQLAADTYTNAAYAHDRASSAEAAAASALAGEAAILAVTDYMTTSATAVSPTVGAKDLVLGRTALAFANADRVTLMRRGDRTVRGRGAVSLANMGANPSTMRVTLDEVSGAGGPYNDWLVMLSDLEVLPPATVADLLGNQPYAAITPAIQKAAAAPVALAFSSTVTPDLSLGRRFTLNASGSFTLGAATNASPGDVFEIDITHTAGGNVMATASAYKRQNGLFVLSTTNGNRDLIVAEVAAVDGSNVVTRAVYNGQRNPTS